MSNNQLLRFLGETNKTSITVVVEEMHSIGGSEVDVN